ncbi:hypothetical protein F6V30_08000 [Oryzomonas sagensis]|uniref:Uncharacterized protein n=1 Tax=Oryzomonas sagensis TaxID=2603857 RepID=A0ABQ6TP44_9BACT|nr:hypothetical protein [Oryzomonas sagensis]KAB0670097.1 hypothetical protein F6V30_08000 [Oryzomonas sagensis]
MVRRELKVEVVLETVEESKKLVTAISGSVGPVSSTRETLAKVDVFIREMEKEVVQSLPEEQKASKYKRLFVFAPLLMPSVKLLTELLAEAKQVIEHFLR